MDGHQRRVIPLFDEGDLVYLSMAEEELAFHHRFETPESPQVAFSDNPSSQTPRDSANLFQQLCESSPGQDSSSLDERAPRRPLGSPTWQSSEPFSPLTSPVSEHPTVDAAQPHAFPVASLRNRVQQNLQHERDFEASRFQILRPPGEDSPSLQQQHTVNTVVERAPSTFGPDAPVSSSSHQQQMYPERVDLRTPSTPGSLPDPSAVVNDGTYGLRAIALKIRQLEQLLRENPGYPDELQIRRMLVQLYQNYR